MSWLSNVVRPKLQQLVGGQREIPEDLWQKCPKCEQMIFHRELEKNLRVCAHCQHHLRLKVGERLKMLFDDGRFEPIVLPALPSDPLRFRDLRRYPERLKEAQAKTGQNEALAVARGTIGGHAAVVAALDFEFLGGSMGVAVGEGFLAAARAAVEDRLPLIAVPASGGARMQEGILSLMQMARTTVAVEEVKAAGLPYIVVLTDPTTGGVSASFSMLGDIAIAETGAVIGFAGARVIQQTIRESLPEGFQTAEYLYDHGIVDIVVRRHELKATLARILGLLVVPLRAPDEALPRRGDGGAERGALPPPEAPPQAEEAPG
jgi:acetyl-CoA carboxylase carboxyl transferase subunit beta